MISDVFKYNYVLCSAVISWVVAQFIKTVLYFVKFRKFNSERMFGAGGMPSSHSALVCCATLAVSRKVGTDSVQFAIMFILAVIVMYDAMGVRRAAGQHAKEINKLNKVIEESTNCLDENDYHQLKEYLGHTPFEVVGGALLGIIIALILPVS